MAQNDKFRVQMRWILIFRQSTFALLIIGVTGEISGEVLSVIGATNVKFNKLSEGSVVNSFL
jgi:hypothetical protein